MDENVISCILPVYNGEKYIRECINSILEQSYRDFELIIVDDGSTDESANIIEEYARKDPRICAYHVSNGGVSAARNKGITVARGKWLTFIDCDDWLENDYLKVMIDLAEDKLDYVVCSQFFNDQLAVRIADNSVEYYSAEKDLKELLGSCIIRPPSCLELFSKKFEYGPIFTGPVCKLYKREIILSNSIRFDVNLKIGEDNLFNLEYLQKCKTGVFINKPLYHYRIVDGSAFHNPNNKLNYWPIYFCYIATIVDKYELQDFLYLKIIIEIEKLLCVMQNTRNKRLLLMRIKKFCEDSFCQDALHKTKIVNLHSRRRKITVMLLKTNNYFLLYLYYGYYMNLR